MPRGTGVKLKCVKLKTWPIAWACCQGKDQLDEHRLNFMSMREIDEQLSRGTLKWDCTFCGKSLNLMNVAFEALRWYFAKDEILGMFLDIQQQIDGRAEGKAKIWIGDVPLMVWQRCPGTERFMYAVNNVMRWGLTVYECEKKKHKELRRRLEVIFMLGIRGLSVTDGIPYTVALVMGYEGLAVSDSTRYNYGEYDRDRMRILIQVAMNSQVGKTGRVDKLYIDRVESIWPHKDVITNIDFNNATCTSCHDVHPVTERLNFIVLSDEYSIPSVLFEQCGDKLGCISYAVVKDASLVDLENFLRVTTTTPNFAYSAGGSFIFVQSVGDLCGSPRKYLDKFKEMKARWDSDQIILVPLVPAMTWESVRRRGFLVAQRAFRELQTYYDHNFQHLGELSHLNPYKQQMTHLGYKDKYAHRMVTGNPVTVVPRAKVRSQVVSLRHQVGIEGDRVPDAIRYASMLEREQIRLFINRGGRKVKRGVRLLFWDVSFTDSRCCDTGKSTDVLEVATYRYGRAVAENLLLIPRWQMSKRWTELEQGVNARTERILQIKDGKIEATVDGIIQQNSNVHAPVLGIKFTREVEILATEGVPEGGEENIVLAVFWDGGHQKDSVLIRNMAQYETLADLMAYDVVFVNLRDLVNNYPIIPWVDTDKIYEKFVGRLNFRVPHDRAQTAAERTRTFSQIVQTMTLTEGGETVKAFYKLVKDMRAGNHVLSVVGTAFMHMASMGITDEAVERQRQLMDKEERRADHQQMDLSVYTRFGQAIATFLCPPIIRLAVFEVVPCSVKEHFISAWHVAFNRPHLNMLLHNRSWSGELENDPEDPIRIPQETDLWYDAILILAEPWLLPYTKHRVMMASCITGQMARATTEIGEWDEWEERVKRLQRMYWSNDLVWLQRHLLRVGDNPRLTLTVEDAPELDPFDRPRRWAELGSATYLTMREVVWPEDQVD